MIRPGNIYRFIFYKRKSQRIWLESSADIWNNFAKGYD